MTAVIDTISSRPCKIVVKLKFKPKNTPKHGPSHRVCHYRKLYLLAEESRMHKKTNPFTFIYILLVVFILAMRRCERWMLLMHSFKFMP